MDGLRGSTSYSSRPLYIVLALAVALVFFLGISQTVELQHARPPPALAVQPAGDQLVDDLEHHLLDRLTSTQCVKEYPELYYDIDKRHAYWKERRHTISEADVDISWRNNPGGGFHGGAMRILIHDNRLRILQSLGTVTHPGGNGYHVRALALLGIIQRALDSAAASGEVLPTVEAAILLEDISHPPTGNGTHSFWTFTAHYEMDSHKRRWLVPNFDFWYAGSVGTWQDARRRAMQHDGSFSSKIPQAVWRGNKLFNDEIRGGLFRVTADEPWADVKNVDDKEETKMNRMPPEDFCKYAMTIHTEGITYSGRLKFLLNCNSLLLTHDLIWTTHWYHLLRPSGPDQNYVHFDRKWTGLADRVQFHLDHPAEAERIINNSIATFRSRYLSRAAQSCYVRKLIHGYADVAWTPEIYRKMDGAHDTRYLRGVPWEQWIVDGKDFDEGDLRE